MNWGWEQTIGAILAGLSFAFMIGVVIWDQLKDRWPFVYRFPWTWWRRRPKRR